MKKSKTQLKREEQHQNKLWHDEFKKSHEKELKPTSKNDFIEVEVPEVTISNLDNNSLLDKFESELGDNDSIKELLTSKNIKLKSDLHEDQIALLTRIIVISDELKLYGEGDAARILDNVVKEFVTLSVSKERKGRGEYVDAHGRKMENQKIIGNSPFGQTGQMQNMR